MKIYITGANGFIGSSFVQQAIANKHEVIAMRKPECLEAFSIDTIRSFKPDVVMHCAWLTDPSVYNDSPYNIALRDLTIRFFKQIRDLKIQRFVACGTCAEYQSSVDPLNEETSAIEPQTLYAAAKSETYQGIMKESQGSSTNITWARIFFPFGPAEHPGKIISSIIRGISEKDPVTIKTPHAIRDFIHVEDVASALLFLCQKKSSGVFNVGTGHGTKLSEINEKIKMILGKKTKRNEHQEKHEQVKKPDSIVASVKKINALGWVNKYTFDTGLATYSSLKRYK